MPSAGDDEAPPKPEPNSDEGDGELLPGLPDDDVVAAICDSSMLSKPHDGFHILSPEWTLTHTNQYIAPPLPPDFQLVGGLAGFGARHMTALLASRLPMVACAGVLNTAKRVLIFADGVLSAEFTP